MATPSTLPDKPPAIAIPKRRARKVARESDTSVYDANPTAQLPITTSQPEVTVLRKHEATPVEQTQWTRPDSTPQMEQSIAAELITEPKASSSLPAATAHGMKKKASSILNARPVHSSSTTRSVRKVIRIQARPTLELQWPDSGWSQDRPRTAWRRVPKEELQQKVKAQKDFGYSDAQVSSQPQGGQKWAGFFLACTYLCLQSSDKKSTRPSRREVKRYPFGPPSTDQMPNLATLPAPEPKIDQYLKSTPVISNNTDIVVQAFQELRGTVTAEQASQGALLNKISDALTKLQRNPNLNQHVSQEQSLDSNWDEDRYEGRWGSTGDDRGRGPKSKPIGDPVPSAINPVGDSVLGALQELRNDFLEEKAYQRKLLNELMEKRNTSGDSDTSKTKLSESTGEDILTALRDLRQDFLHEKMYQRRVLDDLQKSRATNQAPMRRSRSLDNIRRPQVEDVTHSSNAPQESVSADARWEDKLGDLRDIVKQIQDDLAIDMEKAEERRILDESKPGIEDVIDEFRKQNAEQRELVEARFEVTRADYTRQCQGILENVLSTAQKQVSFNYLIEFSKPLALEVRMLLDKVGKLREERRALQHELGFLLDMKSKYGPGGEFDSGWRPQAESLGGPPLLSPPFQTWSSTSDSGRTSRASSVEPNLILPGREIPNLLSGPT